MTPILHVFPPKVANERYFAGGVLWIVDPGEEKHQKPHGLFLVSLAPLRSIDDRYIGTLPARNDPVVPVRLRVGTLAKRAPAFAALCSDLIVQTGRQLRPEATRDLQSASVRQLGFVQLWLQHAGFLCVCSERMPRLFHLVVPGELIEGQAVDLTGQGPNNRSIQHRKDKRHCQHKSFESGFHCIIYVIIFYYFRRASRDRPRPPYTVQRGQSVSFLSV